MSFSHPNPPLRARAAGHRDLAEPSFRTDDLARVKLVGIGLQQCPGTATFADPRSVERVPDELEDWCRGHEVGAVRDLIGEAHAH